MAETIPPFIEAVTVLVDPDTAGRRYSAEFERQLREKRPEIAGHNRKCWGRGGNDGRCPCRESYGRRTSDRARHHRYSRDQSELLQKTPLRVIARLECIIIPQAVYNRGLPARSRLP